MKNPSPWQVSLILGGGVLAVSTAAVLVRLCMEAAGQSDVGFLLFVGATRLAIASALLLPASLVVERSSGKPREPWDWKSPALGWAIAAGLCLGLHFATWTVSLALTSIAASTSLVTTTPIWIALFAWVGFREKPSRLTLLGIAIALAGSLTVAGGGDRASSVAPNPWLGNFLAIVGAWTVSAYFLLGREAQRRGMGLGRYSTIAYTSAAIALFPLPLLWGTGYGDRPPSVYGFILLLAIFPQIVGHTSLNWSVRWLSPTTVTLAVLFEPVAASVLGWLLLGEIPPLAVAVGGAIVLAGVAIAVVGNPEEK